MLFLWVLKSRMNLFWYLTVTGKDFFSMQQWPFIIQNQCDILKTNVTFSNSNVNLHTIIVQVTLFKSID